eukprot:1056740-Prymnesium_polylepis.1
MANTKSCLMDADAALTQCKSSILLDVIAKPSALVCSANFDDLAWAFSGGVGTVFVPELSSEAVFFCRPEDKILRVE